MKKEKKNLPTVSTSRSTCQCKSLRIPCIIIDWHVICKNVETGRFPQNLKNKEMYAGHGQVRVKELSTGIYISLSEILWINISSSPILSSTSKFNVCG